MAQSRKEKLLEQQRAIAAKLKRIDAKENDALRRADTRRKVVAGAIVLEHAQHNPAFKATLGDLLEKFVKPADRALFGLPSLPGQPVIEPEAMARAKQPETEDA